MRSEHLFNSLSYCCYVVKGRLLAQIRTVSSQSPITSELTASFQRAHNISINHNNLFNLIVSALDANASYGINNIYICPLHHHQHHHQLLHHQQQCHKAIFMLLKLSLRAPKASS